MYEPLSESLTQLRGNTSLQVSPQPHNIDAPWVFDKMPVESLALRSPIRDAVETRGEKHPAALAIIIFLCSEKY